MNIFCFFNIKVFGSCEQALAVDHHLIAWSCSFIKIKADSHYCIFCLHLRQMVALLRRDRKIPISALTQTTAESADHCSECEWALDEMRKTNTTVLWTKTRSNEMRIVKINLTASAWLWGKKSSYRYSIVENFYVETKINGFSYSFLVKFDTCFINFTFQVALVVKWSLMLRTMMSKI